MSVNPLLNSGFSTIEMVCNVCSKRTFLFNPSLQNMKNSCKEVGFFVQGDVVTLYGICKCCKENKEKNNEKKEK